MYKKSYIVFPEFESGTSLYVQTDVTPRCDRAHLHYQWTSKYIYAITSVTNGPQTSDIAQVIQHTVMTSTGLYIYKRRA